MTTGIIQNADRFKHYVWRRHKDRSSWQGYRPEILATDGAVVRRLISHPQHVVFQAFRDPDAAMRIISRIEAGIGRGVAMLGYSMFSEEESIAILHTGKDLEPGWLAFPFERGGRFPTLPLTAADQPSLRLVGGASVETVDGIPVLTAALEQRGDSFRESEFAFNITHHVAEWDVVARRGQGKDATRLRITPDSEVEPTRAGHYRLEKSWHLDPIIVREFKDDPDIEIFFKVRFDKNLMCLPNDWLEHWFRIPIRLASD